MKSIKMCLVNNDFAVRCQTCLELNLEDNEALEKFFKEIRDELIIGQTAFLEIDGAQDESFTFAISHNE